MILALGLILLAAAAVAVVRGRIWLDPQRAEFEPRWQPGRWVHHADQQVEFGLGVAWYALIGAMAVGWLRKGLVGESTMSTLPFRSDVPFGALPAPRWNYAPGGGNAAQAARVRS